MNETSQSQGWMNWLQESVTLKLLFICILIILLLIPSSQIESLITERMTRQEQTLKDISDEWSGNQLIQGPVLVIPYIRKVKEKDAKQNEIIVDVTENLYLLPDDLNIKASIDSKLLYRGIFEAVVYTTRLKVHYNFSRPDLNKLSLQSGQLLLTQARLVFGLSDLKGLTSNPVAKIGNDLITAEPETGEPTPLASAIKFELNLSNGMNSPLNFDMDLALKGSEELSFMHLGKNTEVEVDGNWASPSFFGRYLPDERNISKTGFSARWKMVYYNRPFPQQWVVDDTLLNSNKKSDDATFGVRLRLPVDQYQKTMRTSKYALLIILLTFISLFLTELIRRQKIHVFNYILIGAAMIIYYTLLLSFTEQIGYNLAYLVASTATIILITVFIASLLKNRYAALLFALILSVFYAFIFVIIQLEDLSLLVGSIALFVIIAVLMYFSRKINWAKN